MNTPRKAIIIGAGPAGLSVALRLHQTTDIHCTIYEIRPKPTTLGGAVGIPSNGLRLLDRLGVYNALVKRGSSRSDFAVRSLNGTTLGRIGDVVAQPRAQTGFGYMRVKRADVVDVLLQAVRAAGMEVSFDKRLTGIDEGGNRVNVTFSDGSTDTADLLLGCDGIHSSVRQTYVDPGLKPEYSGLAGLFSIIPTAGLSPAMRETVHGLNATITEEGMFIAAPCTAAGDEVFWGFQREIAIPDPDDARDGWEVHTKREVDGFKSTLPGILRDVKGDWGNTLKYLVDRTDVVKFFPVYRLPLGGLWSRGRCLLLGDAAHAMQPHASQGVAMALEDAFLISRLLADPTRSVRSAFESFYRIRAPRVEEIYQTAAQNAGIRKKTGPWGLWLKETAIRASFVLPWGLGIGTQAFGQKYTVYDIDEVKT
ncbi:FAD-dependent oxidoreductase [Aspergillus lucknowensis]|uniref:FAD-binding domain-containing protein n=1 Tax=Aspergillus lucknowensis TaxID=176173 RepID=A0ABR4L6Y7_9EURO